MPHERWTRWELAHKRPRQVGANPKGIFDRTAIGFRSTPVRVEIERGRVAFFSQVIGATNPIHWDAGVARAAGFADVVAPATFAAVIDAAANEQRVRQNEKSILAVINCDRGFLHGEERYDYHGLILAGETLVVECEVADFEDKKGGALELAHLKSTIRHEKRGLLVSMTRSLIHRLA